MRITKSLLQKKLANYTKEQIINGLAFYGTYKEFSISRLVRIIQSIIDEEAQERESQALEQQIKNIQQYKAEYDALRKKYNEQGLLSLSAEEAERLSELMTLIFGA